jgi:hypothetical protein
MVLLLILCDTEEKSIWMSMESHEIKGLSIRYLLLFTAGFLQGQTILSVSHYKSNIYFKNLLTGIKRSLKVVVNTGTAIK